MKKFLIITLYFILIITFNIGFLNININLMDYCNLLFLNTSTFLKYDLSIWNLKYMISFYLLTILIMNFTISYASERTSFFSMVVYRKGKKKTIYNAIKYNVSELLKYYVLLNIIIAISIALMKLVSVEIKYDYLVLNIYLLKYLMLLFILIMKNFIDSMQGEFSTNIVKINILLLILIIIDLIFNVNLITFSGNIVHEILYLLFYIIVGLIFNIYKIYGGKYDRN